MKRKLTLILVVSMLLLGLSACGGSKPDMPMEITVDGYTIVLGETTVADLIQLGYEVKLTKTPDVAKDGDDYIPFDLSVDRGAGDQMFLTVLVPWGKGTNISAETQAAVTEGIIRSVTVTATSVKQIDVLYHGVNTQDITFAMAAEDWGATEEKRDGNSYLRYVLQAKTGVIEVEESTAAPKGQVGWLRVSVSLKEFAAMQKK